jgi:membrane-associated phospholipid phosphatase
VRLARDLLLLGLCFAPPAVSLGQTTTSTQPTVPLFTHNDIYLGAVFAIGTVALMPFDERVARRLQEPDAQSHLHVQQLATVVRLIADPGSLIIGGSLYGIGRLTHHARLADLGLHGTEAIAIGGATTEVIKLTAGRSRPYVTNDTNPRDYALLRGLKGRDYASFPSGHTLSAFAAASAVTAEAGRWNHNTQWIVGTVLYTGATAVGLSRLYNNQHWASDVILAAGIGTFAGNKVVRYEHRTNPHNKVDRWLLGASVSTGTTNAVSLILGLGAH